MSSTFFNIKSFDPINLGQLYSTNSPFPSVVIDGLWDAVWLGHLAEQFDKCDRFGDSKSFYGAFDKAQINTWDDFPPAVSEYFTLLASPVFLKWLEGVTGIVGLIPDPYLKGGGMHRTGNRGFLKMHTDFRWHETMALERRVNVLTYVNSEWGSGYGGDLILKSPVSGETKTIAPVFNRTVIFTTTDQSFHGHPEPMSLPPSVTRKSLAAYFYTAPVNVDKSVTRLETDYRDISLKRRLGFTERARAKLKFLLRAR